MTSILSRSYNSSFSRLLKRAFNGPGEKLFPRLLPKVSFSSRAAGPAGDILICIFQRGGMDGLSVVAPVGDGADYYDNRPNIAIPDSGPADSSVIPLDAQFGFHPALANFKEFYDAGKLAVVHGTGSIDPSRSHFDAERIMEQAAPGNKSIGTGWIARHLESSNLDNVSPFRAVGINDIVQVSLRGTGAVSALALESIQSFRLQGRGDELKLLDANLRTLYGVNAPVDLLDKQGKLVFETIDILTKIGDKKYVPENGAVYPADGFGRSLSQVALLVKADLGLEVACVDIGGWDTHSDQGVLGGNFQKLLTSFSQGIGALYTDLGARTVNLTIVTMSEFGRRIEENGSKGTDHGHGNVMFLLGGGVNGGKVYANWPTLAKDKLDNGDLAITIDQRDVMAEIVGKRLANPLLDQVFPGFTPAATPLNILQQR